MVGRPRTNTQKPVILAFILVALAGSACFAEVETTVKLQLFNTLSMLDEEEAGFIGTGLGGLTFTAVASKNVKAEIAIEVLISATPVFQISRGYLKARLPGFRTTLGKAPISWGQGFAFNAGDVVFRQYTPAEQLSSDILRDMSKMQVSGFIPLGPFSFLEILILPPEIDFIALASDPDYFMPSISETELGARTYLATGPMLIEPGYLYDAETDTHYPYIGLQGHLLADLYATGSVGIETQNPDGDIIYQTFVMSGGGMYLASFDNGGSLTIRLEALLYPAGEWSEQNPEDVTGDNTDSGDEADGGAASVAALQEAGDTDTIYPQYGLLLYPELNWSVTDSIGLFVRSIFCPIDMSALTTVGGNWNIFTGFDLLLYLSIEGGDETDTYAYGNPGWFSATVGAQYIF